MVKSFAFAKGKPENRRHRRSLVLKLMTRLRIAKSREEYKRNNGPARRRS